MLINAMQTNIIHKMDNFYIEFSQKHIRHI